MFSGGVPDPVPTLDKAIEGLKTKLPALIDAAAVDVLKKQKDEAEKRKVVEETLYPMAWDVWQVKKLDAKLQAAKDKELDKLVKESVQRRLYYDILAPINVFRPGDLTAKDAKKRFRIERISDLDVKIDEEVKGFLEQRLDASIAANYKTDVHIGDMWKDEIERDTIEKRRYVAFILFAVGQVQVPVTKVKLYDRGIERAQIISGIFDFTAASIDYVRSIYVLEDRIAKSIRDDRDGMVVKLKDGKLSNTHGFVQEYEKEIDRLVALAGQIDTAEKRLAEAKDQLDRFQKTHAERLKQHKATVDRLTKARTGTKSSTDELVKDLRLEQANLLEALRLLSDAAERNYALEGQIRTIEMDYIRKEQSKKGTKRP
jgi:hypothetical protein